MTTATLNKTFYFYVSLLFSVLLLVTDIINFATTARERPDVLPSSWRISFLLIHAASFFLFLLGYLYTTEGGTTKAPPLAFIVLTMNIVSFLLRIVYETVYVDFHPMAYQSD